MRKNIKRVGFVAASGLAMTSVGLAFAAWTSNADGDANAKSLQTVQSDILANTPTADLYPGGSGVMSVTITNNNPYPAYVSSISAGSSNVNGACAAGSVTSDADAAPDNTVLASGASRVYQLTTDMLATATNDCRNVTFTLPLTAVLTTGS